MAQGEVEVKFSAKGAEELRAQVDSVKKSLNDLSRGNGGKGADFSKITQQLKAANVEAKKLESTLNRAAKQRLGIGGGGAGGVGSVSGNKLENSLKNFKGNIDDAAVSGNKLERQLGNFAGKIDEIGWQFSRLMRVVGRVAMILAAAEVGARVGGSVAYALMDEKNRPSSWNGWRDARATFLNTDMLKAYARAAQETMFRPLNGESFDGEGQISFFLRRFKELTNEFSPAVQKFKEFRAALDKQTMSAKESARAAARVSDAMRRLADITDKYSKIRDLISIDRMKGAGTKRVGDMMQDLSIDIAEANEKLEPERAAAAEKLASAKRARKKLIESEPIKPRDVDTSIIDEDETIAKEYLKKLSDWQKSMQDANEEIKAAQHAFDKIGATVDHLNEKMKKLDAVYQEELAREKKEITKVHSALEKRRHEALYGKEDKSIEQLTEELKELDKAVVENSNEIGMLNSKSEGGWEFSALREKMDELAEQVAEMEAIKAEIETKQAKLEAAERERKEREGIKLGSDLAGASDSLARVGGYLGGNVFNMQITNIQREIAKNTRDTAAAVKNIKPAQTVFN